MVEMSYDCRMKCSYTSEVLIYDTSTFRTH